MFEKSKCFVFDPFAQGLKFITYPVSFLLFQSECSPSILAKWEFDCHRPVFWDVSQSQISLYLANGVFGSGQR